MSVSSCEPCVSARSKSCALAKRRSARRRRAAHAPFRRARAAVTRPDHLVRDPVQLEQLERLGVVARRDRDLVPALLEQPDQRPEERTCGEFVMSIQTRIAGDGCSHEGILDKLLMDTRQLAAFCAVVERQSFSQAAERLGVTQPAVSLQVRALEKRLGTQLLDRSGRRVEPTEAGLRLYRGAQRMLALEEQLVDEVAGEGAGALTGELALGASTGPAAIVVPLLLCEFQRAHPDVRSRSRPRHADGRRPRRRPRARARHRRRGAPPPRRSASSRSSRTR